ncbi:unnamed protein product [Triticum turgidum subsp. durum]|uniref:Uncharacterized protein n=1 Tax=Triticum turgidum subsp. durum TaxID=4567 RepID=A0A9R0S1Y9_TRITD|nr:unnamed protein product [Triticum turgidum subsp. durum]
MALAAERLRCPSKWSDTRRPPQDIYTGPGVPHVSVTLLYKGHYDIIYPCAPCVEGSSQVTSQREHPAD